MITGKSKIGLFLLSLLLITGCIREDDHNGGEEECSQRLMFYSLDRENNNVLSQYVGTGDLYALHPDGTQAGAWYFSPIPTTWQLPLLDGMYDLILVGNLTENMEYNTPPTRASGTGNVKMIAGEDSIYYEADDIHVGVLPSYQRKRESIDRIDSIHVKRMVGMMSVRINTDDIPADFLGEIEIEGVGLGVDFFQNFIPHSVTVRKSGGIIHKRININARCFPSIDPLKITVKVLNKVTGMVIAKAIKRIEEPLTRNKQIIIEYNFHDGNLVEIDLIVKDWDQNTDHDIEEAYTNE